MAANEYAEWQRAITEYREVMIIVRKKFIRKYGGQVRKYFA